jgi:hypothetical protein
MPCRDYEDDRGWQSAEVDKFRVQNDRLARIACKVMQELERQGTQDFLLLKDEEVRTWWIAHKEADAKAAAARKAVRDRAKEKARLKKIKEELLAQLTEDQKKALEM